MSPSPSYRSLATKFFVFTATLVFWVLTVLIGYDIQSGHFDLGKGLVVLTVVLLVATAISRMTTRLLVRPLRMLQDGIRAVEHGRFEPLHVSRTNDEIELLGDSFNRMVGALRESKAELVEHQDKLEQRIRERTREFEEAAKRATAASEAKTEFLANISHELRTPMNGLLGMLEMALSGPLSHEQRDQLDTAHSCAYSLLALLNDILDLSKIEAGGMALERIPFSPRELAADTARAHATLARRKGLRFEQSVSNDVPELLEGDPLRLRQIIANLLSNAVKFTEAGRIDFALSTESGRLKIEVTDTGMGIPADKLESVFEKFTQADGSITRRYGGTGLGLTITRRLVEMHDGSIAVESAPGLGTAFTVCLPLRPALGIHAAAPRHARILVVDDNAVNRKMVTSILEKNGFSTAIATNGEQALATLARCEAELVLMDLQMPVLDGIEATRHIRRDPRWYDLPIVAMTANAMDGDQQSCIDAGMTAYLSKPVNARHLLRVVHELLASRYTVKAAAHC